MTFGHLLIDAVGGIVPSDLEMALNWTALRPRRFSGDLPDGAAIIAVCRAPHSRLLGRLSELSTGIPSVPILAVAQLAHGDDAGTIRSRCLLAGADACVVLPVDAQWAGEQATALLRRVNNGGTADSDEVSLNPGAMRLRVGGQWHRFTPTEFALLQYLIHNEGIWVRATELATCGVLGHFDPRASNLRWHVHQIRLKLGAFSRFVHSSRGLGYMFSRDGCGSWVCPSCGGLKSGDPLRKPLAVAATASDTASAPRRGRRGSNGAPGGLVSG